MPVESPVSERLTVTSLLLLTFATGLVDAVSVLVLGHVFVANMTGNVIFLGFWFVPQSGVDMTAAVVAFVGFMTGTVLGGRLARGGCAVRLDDVVRELHGMQLVLDERIAESSGHSMRPRCERADAVLGLDSHDPSVQPGSQLRARRGGLITIGCGSHGLSVV